MRALPFALVSIGALAVTVLPTQADTLSVRFSWAGISACAAISPAFELGGVPVGTKRLRFIMTDLYALTFHHGGSTVTYDGDSVSKGAIRYTGPCPPRGERHNYRWTVFALDSADRVLGSASAEAMFPPDGLDLDIPVRRADPAFGR
jgi:hypothetical protein